MCFAYPVQEKIERGYGTNRLIQKGARLVIEPNEIIEKYTGSEIRQISIEELEKSITQKAKKSHKVKEEYRRIYQVLSQELSINEISKKTKIDIVTLYEKLFMMEMEGLISNSKNKYKIKE